MARTVTWDDLRALAGVEARKGYAISLYVDLDPRVTATAGDVHTRVNSLLDEAAKSAEASRGDLSHDARQALRADLERLRRFFEQEFNRDGARGAAAFCGSLDGIWVTRGLTDPVPDDVRVDRRLYLAPLVPLVGRGDGGLVLVASRKQGRFYALRGGRLEELTDLTDEQPRRHDQGGWSQARMQRHVDELASEHLRQLADELDRHVRRAHGGVRVVVVSPEETWAELSGFLSQDAERALAGWAQADTHASPAELLELAAPVLERARAEHEKALVERWREEAGRNGRAAAGWAATLDAASDGRVETLLVSNGADRPAWRCRECGRASAEAGDCPLHGATLEPVEKGLDLAVHQALVHGGTVWVAEHSRDLDPVEGIGAVLRF
jgi:peptide chain release factor subunit 1